MNLIKMYFKIGSMSYQSGQLEGMRSLINNMNSSHQIEIEGIRGAL
jgi:hypothetical protein